MKKFSPINLALLPLILICLSLNGQKTTDPATSGILEDGKNANAGFGYLTCQWVGVIDNGEGDDWPHGPLGSLHILVYSMTEECPGNKKSYNGFLNHVYLTGPTKNEWKDGDTIKTDLCIFQWRSEDDAVKIVVYESDPGGIGRAHDEKFCAIVSRKGTSDIVAFNSIHLALPDAIRNCIRKGITWHKKFQNDGPFWNGELSIGIPAMFMKFQTKDQVRLSRNQSAWDIPYFFPLSDLPDEPSIPEVLKEMFDENVWKIGEGSPASTHQFFLNTYMQKYEEAWGKPCSPYFMVEFDDYILEGQLFLSPISKITGLIKGFDGNYYSVSSDFLIEVFNKEFQWHGLPASDCSLEKCENGLPYRMISFRFIDFPNGPEVDTLYGLYYDREKYASCLPME